MVALPLEEMGQTGANADIRTFSQVEFPFEFLQCQWANGAMVGSETAINFHGTRHDVHAVYNVTIIQFQLTSNADVYYTMWNAVRFLLTIFLILVITNYCALCLLVLVYEYSSIRMHLFFITFEYIL